MNNHLTPLKLGTRGSLLALTQSQMVADRVQQLTGRPVDLVKIKTQGDLKTLDPLWKMEGKDFFSAELDQALLKGEVDFVVHSYKDLGSVRPAGIEVAAITQRFYPQDILLLPRKEIEQWPKRRHFKVGTSSPRRMHLLQRYLPQYLPPGASRRPVEVEAIPLRGNVNTRIEKLLRGDFHGIVLALAGLERLAQVPRAHQVLAKLIGDLGYSVLPTNIFPCSPAQGALAVETLSPQARGDGGALARTLLPLHHLETAREVNREKAVFSQYGGGCHLPLGVHCVAFGEQLLQWKRGHWKGEEISQKTFEGQPRPPRPLAQQPVFIGLPPERLSSQRYTPDQLFHKEPIDPIDWEQVQGHLYITSPHCLPPHPLSAQIWSSGEKTHRHLVQRGHWVWGSAQSLGDPIMERLFQSQALRSMNRGPDKVWVASAQSAESNLGQVLPCYRRVVRSPSQLDPKLIETLNNCRHFFWTSGAQFQAYSQHFSHLMEKSTYHYCGLGKTYKALQVLGVSPHPFCDLEQFYQWVGQG